MFIFRLSENQTYGLHRFVASVNTRRLLLPIFEIELVTISCLRNCNLEILSNATHPAPMSLTLDPFFDFEWKYLFDNTQRKNPLYTSENSLRANPATLLLPKWSFTGRNLESKNPPCVRFWEKVKRNGGSKTGCGVSVFYYTFTCSISVALNHVLKPQRFCPPREYISPILPNDRNEQSIAVYLR